MTSQALIAHIHAATAAPDTAALVFRDQTLSHGQMARLGQAFAQRMAQAGIGRDAQIVLDCLDPAVILATMLGAAWLGARMLPYGLTDTPDAPQISHRLHIAQHIPQDGSILIDQSWSPALTPVWQGLPTPDPDAPFLCVQTSGTTGIPKSLWLTQAQIVARSRAVSDEFQPGSRHVLLFPAHSRPFLARAFAALLNGSTLVFDLAPGDWPTADIHMVSGARAHLGAVMQMQLAPKCPRLEVIGSRVPDKDLALLLNSFDLVDDTYGASETSKTYSTLWTLDHQGQPLRRSGWRDTDIALLGADGAAVPMGQDGEVRLRNAYMATGYINDPTATAAAFRDGGFWPGDVAWQDDQGCLHFRDRMDHIVNLRGNKVNAHAIDQILRSVDGIQDAICFRNPKPDAEDELFAFVVYSPTANRLQAMATARHRITEKMGKDLVPRVIQGIAGIPRKADRTPDRQACADLVLSMAKRE